ncbi:hypothetical protein ACOME3_010832, partial [Neoechinorhynchus agilis]
TKMTSSLTTAYNCSAKFKMNEVSLVELKRKMPHTELQKGPTILYTVPNDREDLMFPGATARIFRSGKVVVNVQSEVQDGAKLFSNHVAELIGNICLRAGQMSDYSITNIGLNITLKYCVDLDLLFNNWEAMKLPDLRKTVKRVYYYPEFSKVGEIWFRESSVKITAHGNEMLQLSGTSAEEMMEKFKIVEPLLEISKKTNKPARSSSKPRKRTADVELSDKSVVAEPKRRLTEHETTAKDEQHQNETEVKRSRPDRNDPDRSVQRVSSYGVSTGSTQWPLVQMGQSFSQQQQINRSHQRSIQQRHQNANTSVQSNYMAAIPSYGESFVQPMSSQQEVPLDLSMPRGRYPIQQDNRGNVYSQHSYQLQRYPQTWTPYDLIAVQPQAQPMSNAYNNFQGTSLSTSNEYVYRPGYFRMINQSVPNSMEVYPGGYYAERPYINERFPQRLYHRGNQSNPSRMVHNLQNYYDGARWSSQHPNNFQGIPQFPTRMQMPQGENYRMAYNPNALVPRSHQRRTRNRSRR